MSDALAAMGLLCKTCGKDEQWHKDNPDTRHKYNDGSIPASETFGKRLPDGSRTSPGGGTVVEAVEAPWPFDPVLRQALIDKGVLTPEDLQAAEMKIRAVTAQFAASGGAPS